MRSEGPSKQQRRAGRDPHLIVRDQVHEVEVDRKYARDGVLEDGHCHLRYLTATAFAFLSCLCLLCFLCCCLKVNSLCLSRLHSREETGERRDRLFEPRLPLTQLLFGNWLNSFSTQLHKEIGLPSINIKPHTVSERAAVQHTFEGSEVGKLGPRTSSMSSLARRSESRMLSASTIIMEIPPRDFFPLCMILCGKA